MNDPAADPADSIRQALDATQSALHHYAQACQAIQRLPHPSLASSLLDLNARRLEAMRLQLAKRDRTRSSVEALYTDLNVLHAGLLSLADATGRLRSAYHGSLPVSEPAQGWFTDESADGEAAAPSQPEPGSPAEAD